MSLRFPQTGSRTADLLIPVCLIAFLFLLAPYFIGFSFGDDTAYLSAGDTIKVSALVGPQDWSPLYCLWFKLLSLFVADSFVRSFVSLGILAFAAALLPTFMRIRSAWLYASLLIDIPFLTAFPYVGLFAGVILLLGTCLVLRRDRSLSGVLAMACGFCFVVSFCRPEFSFFVYLSAVLTLVALALEHLGHPILPAVADRRSTPLRTTLIAFAVVAMASSIFCIFTQSPANRSGIAFAEHYNRRAAERGLLARTPDLWASGYVEQSFGIDLGHTAVNGTASVGDFLRANPRLFLGHVLSNLADPRTLVFLLFVLAIVAWPWLRRDAAHLRASSVWISVIALPPLISIVVIYPRDHYALILLPSLLLLATQLVPPGPWMRPPVAWVVGLGCALMWTLNVAIPRLRHTVNTLERQNFLRTECIRQADASADPANPNVFDISSMTSIYLIHPRTVEHPADLAQWTQFMAWVDATHPAWISMEPWVATPYNKPPAEVAAFLSGKLGYTAHPCASRADLTLYTLPQPQPSSIGRPKSPN